MDDSTVRASARRMFAMVAVLAGAVACGESTAPGAELRLTLLDDAGRSAGRHQVLITQPDGAVDTTGTGREGVLTFRVRTSGAHEIRVVPSTGFEGGLPGLRRAIVLDEAQPTQLRFTLQRAGAEPYAWWIEECQGWCG